MNPVKLGYAEINFGADLKKILPKTIPGFWSDTTLNMPYMNQMRLFLDGELNPKSLFFTRPGIIKNQALMHLESISNSVLLDRAQKLTVCSFLSSLWFTYLNLIPTDEDLQRIKKRSTR